MGSSLLLAHSHTHRSSTKKKLLSMSGYFTALFRAADADANGLLEACELQDHLKIVDAVQANIKSQMAEKKETELTPESLEEYFLAAMDTVENCDHFSHRS